LIQRGSHHASKCEALSFDRECLAGPSLEASQAAGGKPLVVVIENTEAADLTTLQDLILVLSEVMPFCSPIALVRLRRDIVCLVRQ